jgi:hypothetical protein
VVICKWEKGNLDVILTFFSNQEQWLRMK